jgi:nicotinate-nucleotide adenylyltransferase
MLKAVFGGTFDPPHNGHLNLAQAVLENKLADRVLFLPALIPPHKTSRKISSFQDRLNMLNLAIADCENFEISMIEAERNSAPSYTVDSMEALSRKFPGDKLLLLIGGDSLKQLHTWHQAVKLASNWDILTYPRPGDNIPLAELKLNWPEELAVKLFNSINKKLPEWDISSTIIREDLKAGKDLEELLPRSVSKYALKKRLYL